MTLSFSGCTLETTNLRNVSISLFSKTEVNAFYLPTEEVFLDAANIYLSVVFVSTECERLRVILPTICALIHFSFFVCSCHLLVQRRLFLRRVVSVSKRFKVTEHVMFTLSSHKLFLFFPTVGFDPRSVSAYFGLHLQLHFFSSVLPTPVHFYPKIIAFDGISVVHCAFLSMKWSSWKHKKIVTA